MSEPQHLTRRQQLLQELSAATVRALAGEPEVHFSHGALYVGDRALPARAPYLRLDEADASLRDLRSIGDAQALRLRYSDPGVFARLAPEAVIERLVFDLLEQQRVESLAPDSMPGLIANIDRRFQAWSVAFEGAGMAESDLGMLLFTVVQMVRSRLTGRPVPPAIEDFLEPTRAGLAPELGNALAGMRRHRSDQERFAEYALEVARLVGNTLADMPIEDDDKKPHKFHAAFAFLLDFDDDTLPELPQVATSRTRTSEDSPAYRVYSDQYDAVNDAREGIRQAVLKDYRERLDGLVAELRYSRFRLSRLLMESLMRPRQDVRVDGQEEGRIDARRLARLVAAPADRHLFFHDEFRPASDSTVTFLIDCSGSMKEHVTTVAPLIDILSRALDGLQVEHEILGFTTGGWNGGRIYKQWMARGRPPHAGRLNEVNYRIFKAPEQSWRQARRGISALFKADRYREGIDGEAVQWAASRLWARTAGRRILVVISDGCPADSATQLVNGESYLDEHLKTVVRQIERSGVIELRGVGLGLDLSPYYRRSVALRNEGGLTNEALHDVARLLAPLR